MSRTVHILKLFQENQECFKPLRKEQIYNAFLTMKYHDKVFKEMICGFNLRNNISVGPLFHRGLSLPRLKILMALLAQKDDVTLCLRPPLSDYNFKCNMDKTPTRYRDKFLPLMVNGFYLLGTMIEDSLNEDPTINCTNPFGFEHGDLGFWWAGVVILDWMKYIKEKYKSGGEANCHTRCVDFYYDPCLSRKYKYNQNSALSSLNRIPQQFLQEDDNVNFATTISEINYDSKRRSLRSLTTSKIGCIMLETTAKEFRKASEEAQSKVEEITPQKEQEENIMKVGLSTVPASGQATTYTKTTKIVEVAVLAKKYPETILSNEELSELEEAIVIEIAERGAPCKIQFEGIHFKHGYVIVDCINQETADWLECKATHLKEWKGIELTACSGDDIPSAHNVTVYFPRSAGKDDKFVLSLVEAQNEGLCTQMWKVLRSKEEGGGKRLIIGIDDHSYEKIKKDDNHIFFRFGKIPVHGLEEGAAEKVKESEVSFEDNKIVC